MNPLYSWETHREPLPLDLLDVTIDAEVRGHLIDAGRRRLRLDLADGWSQLTLRVRVTVPEAPRVADPTSVAVLVTCTRTRSRLPVVLVPVGDGAWTGEVRVLRALVAGTAELVAVVAATVDGRVRFVGRSDAWSLIVEAGAAPAPPGAPPFPVQWVDFSAASAPIIVRRVRDAPAVMDPALPMLYLNDGIEGLRGLLHADTARGERRRARDLLGAEVARTAFTALLRTAVAEVIAADGDAPEASLPHQVLSLVARHLTTTADLDELCRRIVTASAGAPTEIAELWTELDGAVARLCQTPGSIAALAKEARNA